MLEMNSYEKWLTTFLKAEVIGAEFMQRGIPFDKIIYKAQSAFKKSYRADVDRVATTDDAIELFVNRDSIYDRLPEGLFHQTRGNSGSSVTEMVSEHKRYKEEENAARHFFSPFEQEFFRYSLMIEQEERRISGNLDDDKMLQLFLNFWNFENDLPISPVAVFIRTLPWLSVIKGELQLTARTLEFMLKAPVIAEEIITTECLQSESKTMLGNSSLGMDTIAGGEVSIPFMLWKFTIRAIPAKDIHLFTDGAPFDRFLKKFEDYFIPLDVDTIFEYETLTGIEEDSADAVLGYSLTL